jgi:hypothetical protein
MQQSEKVKSWYWSYTVRLMQKKQTEKKIKEIRREKHFSRKICLEI